jgi:regulator of extracellular matrix RemA (YlzA/DUF370 family)
MELLDIEEVGTTALPPAERAALALDSGKAERHLTELATKHASITLVKDKAGREQAHGAAMELTRARTAVERAAKEAREDATKFSKAVIAEAARLVAIVEPEETRLKAVRDAWDAEQARIKAEAEAKERARVLAITERIAAIKSYVVLANNCRTSERVADLQTKLAGVELLDFEEFADEAGFAYADATAHLADVLADRKAQEAQQARIKAEQEAESARLKAEREELARQQAEAAAAIKKQQDELAAQREAAAAEARRVADEARAQAEAAEARVRAAAEEMAAQRAELERMRAELEAKSKPAAEPMLTEAARLVDMVSGIGGAVDAVDGPYFPADPEPAPVAAEPAPVVAHLPPAPVASAIVLAVASYWDTDNKTAARWITERAAEIESLKG